MQLWKNHLTLGTDPEIFVKSGTDLLPAFQFLPDKKTPKTVHPQNLVKNLITSMPERCEANVFWDGFQAEFSCPAQNCIAWIPDGIRTGLMGIWDEARTFNPTAKLTSQNVFQIPIATLRSAREEHVMLGCDASQNAYGMMGKHVMDARKLRYRFAGGHIHFGLNTSFNKVDQEFCEKVVRYLDMVLGVWAVGVAASIDNPIRREYYGLAGEFRMPPHGLEYRTLSNFWHIHPGLSNLVLMIARAIIFANTNLLDKWIAHPQETVEVINSCDVKRARKILSDNSELFRQIIGDLYGQKLKLSLNGLESVVKDPEDFEKNWKFEGGWRGHAGPGESWSTLQDQIQIAA